MKKAYLIIDMSNDFVDEGGSLTVGLKARNIVPAILERAEAFHAAGDLVIFCMDSHAPDDAHFGIWPVHCVKGTRGQMLYGELGVWYDAHKKDGNVLYVPKSDYDAFYKTDLAAILINNDITDVYAAGVCTDMCVFNTVYGAYKSGFKTHVAPGECATFTENQHIFITHMNTIYKTEIVG